MGLVFLPSCPLMPYRHLQGLARTERITVDEARTIEFLGDRLRVYSTPSMIDDVEHVALRLIQAHLEHGQSSVGVYVELEHLGATPLGWDVDITVRVRDVDENRVTVDAHVKDAVELVGQGRHARFIIDIDRYAKKLGRKFVEAGV